MFSITITIQGPPMTSDQIRAAVSAVGQLEDTLNSINNDAVALDSAKQAAADAETAVTTKQLALDAKVPALQSAAAAVVNALNVLLPSPPNNNGTGTNSNPPPNADGTPAGSGSQ
jgi:hypothetical protein